MAPSPHLTSIKGFDGRLVEALLDEALALPYPRPVLGISGLQGSGKSTLAGQLVAAGKHRGVAVVAMSLDDFYLGRRERLALAKNVHPLLATRGPPGTHDLGLAHASFDALMTQQTGETVLLPRFDKLFDRRLPPSKWRSTSTRPRLVVFEGWCLGVTPEDEAALPEPINALEREQDAASIWRRYCNHRLADYQPLWRRMDRLVFLQPPGFEIVTSWRWQQEQAMQALRPGKSCMDQKDIERFVQLFERVSRQAMRTLPDLADRVISLDASRRLKSPT